jgi:DNA-binding beta-propeller fold protein YncE
LEPLVIDSFQRFDYIRMVWPMQDYWDLTWERISNVFKSAELQEALWDLWFDRDYRAYGELTGRSYSLEEWQPSDKMRLYVRKDIIAIASGGDVDEFVFEEDFVSDPYQESILDLAAEQILGGSGTSSGQFQAPHGIAVAPDGSIYIADTGNHRIQHLSLDGETLHVWGTLSPTSDGTAPGGSFNEPWGIAIAPDGYVLVADTWNHRIQKFSPDGTFVTAWGEFGLPDTINGYYGPRDVVVDPLGRVYVTDTGNKRVSVHDSDGTFLFQVGSGGYLAGELDEPVGFDLNSEGNLLIADTWNLRIQSFSEIETDTFAYQNEWLLEGWYGQSIENKPYLAVGPEDQFCVTDPEGHRVLCFNKEGEYLFGWGSFGSAADQFNLPSGIAFGPDGDVWVVDGGNNRVMRFNPPWGEEGGG